MSHATDKLYQLSLTELAAGLDAREFSSRELIETLLARIAQEGAALNAFITVTADAALAAADAADQSRAGPNDDCGPADTSAADDDGAGPR